uniref:uncharacterized protein LOC117716037 n=1 Tax=Arvicanthis niloticus TaxID=61156 RepID=UPI001486A9A4|nr:uncharacterized protein LOC117716037 [Arvicanthis niloticus]
MKTENWLQFPAPAAALVLRRAAAARAVRAAGASVDLDAPLLRTGTRQSCGAEEAGRGGGVGLAARGEHTEMRNRCRSWTELCAPPPARSLPQQPGCNKAALILRPQELAATGDPPACESQASDCLVAANPGGAQTANQGERISACRLSAI